MTSIRIVFADDHPILLAGVRALLQSTPGLDLVGEATSGTAALDLVRTLTPDVAVIDISMPDISGIELARLLAAECPSVQILALTAHEDRAYVQSMLASGARGYLLKRSAADELARAIRAVAMGGLYLDPAIASLVIAHAPSADIGEQAHAELSPREEDVLRYTARGLSNKEIAARLEISTKTAETYKARALEKLGLRTRADIVRHGAARGWLLAL